jgi:hypothetical protein
MKILYIYDNISLNFLEIKTFHTKFVGKIKTQFLFAELFIF